VKVYVFDSGIQRTHSFFNFGQVRDFQKSGRTPYLEPSISHSAEDFLGHGTYVAGIIKMVAPAVKLVNVKIVNASSVVRWKMGVVNVLHDVITEHEHNVATRPEGFRGSVINMSVGAYLNPSLHAAILIALKAGIPVIAAAGNRMIHVHDDDTTYPCRIDEVICVGSVD